MYQIKKLKKEYSFEIFCLTRLVELFCSLSVKSDLSDFTQYGRRVLWGLNLMYLVSL